MLNFVQALRSIAFSGVLCNCRLALECLVRLASVRRSLFSSDVERSKFLNRLVNGCRCAALTLT
jgi:hypothetical protein